MKKLQTYSIGLRAFISAMSAFACMLIFSQSGAQSLSFSQVLKIEHSATGNGGGNILISTQGITVPTGKVWKIESFGYRRTNPSVPTYVYSSMSNSGEGVTLDNMVLFMQSTASPNAIVQLPVWLPSGNYSLRIHYDNTYNYTHLVTLTVIEFNIVP